MRRLKMSTGFRFDWRVCLVAALVLTGCAGRGEIAPENTAGALVVLGMSTEGRPVTSLGYYYVFNFLDANETPLRQVVRPRANDSQIIFDQLPPGQWTLASFAARPAPGVDGFESVSLRQKPVELQFPVVEGAVQVLSQELVIDHSESRAGLTLTRPRLAPLSESTLRQVERRLDRLGPQWQRIQEPVGELPEYDEPPRRGLLERLFGE